MCDPQIITLQNEALEVCVIPALGGKISSLLDRKSAHECLFQNPKGIYRQPALYDHFSDYDASGFDDAFPNIDESWSELNGRVVHFPDHGEIWTMPMRAEMLNQAVLLQGQGRVLPYRYEKKVSLEGRSMRVTYGIENTGKGELPFLWTMHCLMQVDADTQLLLPGCPAQAENVLAGTDLGPVGAILDVQGGPVDLRTMPAYGPTVMRKYYLAGPVQEGCCGYVFPRHRLRLTISYDPKRLPYLGFWCTMGGFRGDVNAALEPSSAYYDSIEIARTRGTLPMVKPGESVTFDILFHLADYDEGDA